MLRHFTRTWAFAGIGAACLIASTCAVAQSTGRRAQPFAVTSSLQGKNVLPHRIHWLARPKGGTVRVVEVEFLIDGRKSWVEKNAPYSYGDDGNWLVTSALAPGTHRFTVRAKAADGTTAQRTTVARVLPALAPPAPLAATWQRLVTQDEAGSETPGGLWIISVDRAGWRIKDPQGYENWIDAAYPADGRFELRGGIWTNPFDPAITKRGGNGWCQETNAPVDYVWAVSADLLTIAHDGADACGSPNNKESQIVAGAWTRVG